MTLAALEYRFLIDIKAKFEQFCPDEISQIVPCSEADIAELEERLSVRLPQAYREFLLWMGRGEGFLSTGDRYVSLVAINEAAREIVTRKAPQLNLRKDAFIVCLGALVPANNPTTKP